jgi:nucleoside-diphosphate-sugar epimerase
MNILITGALGYIGSEVLVRLSQRPDITIYAIDNNSAALRNRGAYFRRFPNIHIIATDITKPFQLPKVDLIVHLAAMVGYTICNQNPELTYQTNVEGTRNIVALNTPTIFFSTGSVYGKIGANCDETVEVNPCTVYSVTKYQAEQHVKSVPHVIFRPATAFGLGLKTRHDLLIHDLTRQATHNHFIDLYQPQARRSFYSVQKLAQLVEFTINNFDQFVNGIYNVGCARGNISKQHIVDLLKKHVDFECNIVPGSDADTRDYTVNYDRLAALWPDLDEDFEQVIPKLVNYYKQW